MPLSKGAPLAQLDRATDYGSVGREFESLRARHNSLGLTQQYGGLLPSVSPAWYPGGCSTLPYPNPWRNNLAMERLGIKAAAIVWSKRLTSVVEKEGRAISLYALAMELLGSKVIANVVDVVERWWSWRNKGAPYLPIRTRTFHRWVDPALAVPRRPWYNMPCPQQSRPDVAPLESSVRSLVRKCERKAGKYPRRRGPCPQSGPEGADGRQEKQPSAQ